MARGPVAPLADTVRLLVSSPPTAVVNPLTVLAQALRVTVNPPRVRKISVRNRARKSVWLNLAPLPSVRYPLEVVTARIPAAWV